MSTTIYFIWIGLCNIFVIEYTGYQATRTIGTGTINDSFLSA